MFVAFLVFVCGCVLGVLITRVVCVVCVACYSCLRLFVVSFCFSVLFVCLCTKKTLVALGLNARGFLHACVCLLGASCMLLVLCVCAFLVSSFPFLCYCFLCVFGSCCMVYVV